MTASDSAKPAARPRDMAPAQRRLQELAYATSHDLRAPLRGIAMLAEWLEDDLKPVLAGHTLEQMQLLRQRIARMDRLLTELTRYSTACCATFEVEQTDVAALVAGVFGSIEHPPGFTIDLRLPLPVLETASAALREVLLELVGNAIEHHDRRQGRVVVLAADVGAFFEFCVADDGPGIPVASHERLFRLFHGLRPKEGTEGCGVGLAIVKLLVEDAGGRIAVDSDGHRGTRFQFTWPKAPAPGWIGSGQ
jgi:signal transduction histidine kinase